MIVCKACGTENPDGAAFCSKCARKLDVATQQRIVEQRAAHTATGVNWSAVFITAILLIIVVALVALFALHVIVL